jgi:flagellar biosynthesis anti-sigma factor FlgM
MIPQEKKIGRSTVTNLADVREAKAQAGNDAEPSHAEPTHAELHGNRRFDAEKVACIKAAIAAGEYKINPESIAGKFIEHERNQ